MKHQRGNRRSLLLGLVKQFNLDLTGLTVYTEAASGHYLFTPILAAMAGTEFVYGQTRDSHFGFAKDIENNTLEIAQMMGVSNRIKILTQRSHSALAESDIITNSGFVRPIDEDLIGGLKTSAVIPLMWETWEYRESDFDLKYCKKRDILVLGTNERHPACDMSSYIGWLSLKLIFELGFDGGHVLVLGNAPIPVGPIVEYMRRVNIDVTWVSAKDDGDLRYEEVYSHFQSKGARYDVMIIAEHENSLLLLGRDGILDIEMIRTINPDLKIGVICGNINAEELENSGLLYLPKEILPFGYISYQTYMLGERPVLNLYTAGLKVGEAMARARLKGLSPRDSAIYVLKNSPAMDFEGELAWVQ
ncbi:MAG TPA: hypothetical protein ENH85_14170 [Candidatus Scalindua sp.]|nr:hypothetical protein [Candidatus Scalindua sp.]